MNERAGTPADKVLIVDDSPESLAFLIAAIEQSGATVLVAKSGEAALDSVKQIVPDIVLLDAVMPGLDGFETCEQLKKLPSLADVPVIFMTGLSEPEHVVHALQSGGVDYLTKPIHVDELRARINVHLASSRRARGASVALDASGRHLIAVGGGEVLWATPQAHKLVSQLPGYLDELASAANAQLNAVGPAGLQVGTEVMPATSKISGLMLVYLGAVAAGEHLFRLVAAGSAAQAELLADHFGLTARESEILTWIVRGKSNRDIGEILGLSPRTVNKHLEQVFAKLGVENRALAAVRATYVLNDALAR